MKQFYALLLTSLTVTVVSAQNLTRTDIGYTVGESYTIYANNQYIDPGTSGNGVTWDVTAINQSSESDVTIVTNNSGDFTSANIIYQLSTGPQVYYNINNSMMEIIAYDLSFTTMDYSNPGTYLNFPVTSTLNTTDQFQCTFTSGGVLFTRSGTLQHEYSGSGTLITPLGTYTDVVRVKTTQIMTDTYSGGTINYTIVAYNWYKAGIHHEIANVSTTVSSSGNSAQAYYTNASVSVGLDESVVETKLWPNPTEDYLNFSCIETIKAVQITNLQGQVIEANEVLATKGKLEVGNLPTGMYIARFELENGESILKQFSKK